jgi:hypothetical protein
MRTTALAVAVAVLLGACAGAPEEADCAVQERDETTVPDGYPYRFGTLVCYGRESAYCSTDPRVREHFTYTTWGEWNCW